MIRRTSRSIYTLDRVITQNNTRIYAVIFNLDQRADAQYGKSYLDTSRRAIAHLRLACFSALLTSREVDEYGLGMEVEKV